MFNAVSSRPSLACGGAKQYWAGLDEVEANTGQLSKQGIEEGCAPINIRWTLEVDRSDG
jgi:hypothetical protein